MFTLDLKKLNNIINNGIEFHRTYKFDNMKLEAFRKCGDSIFIEVVMDKMAFVISIKEGSSVDEIKDVIVSKIRELVDERKRKLEQMRVELTELYMFNIKSN
jgi:hypothetical protein